jgi:hypothetical protein
MMRPWLAALALLACKSPPLMSDCVFDDLTTTGPDNRWYFCHRRYQINVQTAASENAARDELERTKHTAKWGKVAFEAAFVPGKPETFIACWPHASDDKAVDECKVQVQELAAHFADVKWPQAPPPAAVDATAPADDEVMPRLAEPVFEGRTLTAQLARRACTSSRFRGRLSIRCFDAEAPEKTTTELTWGPDAVATGAAQVAQQLSAVMRGTPEKPQPCTLNATETQCARFTTPKATGLAAVVRTDAGPLTVVCTAAEPWTGNAVPYPCSQLFTLK